MALETIPEALPAPRHDDGQPAEESVTIVVMRGDEAVEVEVLRAVELRHVQKCLCNSATASSYIEIWQPRHQFQYDSCGPNYE